jgi:hypothetical protein
MAKATGRSLFSEPSLAVRYGTDPASDDSEDRAEYWGRPEEGESQPKSSAIGRP